MSSMSDLITKRWPVLALATAAVALGTALIAQFVFDLPPCELCIWQRWPYVAAGLLAAIAMVTGRTGRFMALLVALCFAATAGIAVWHVGVEEGIWQGLATCSGADTPNDLEALRAQVLGTQPARCDDVPWSMFGISIAGYNVLFAGASALIMFFAGVFRRG